MSNIKGKNIMLIGFMGSGKTSAGIRLSYKLQLPVMDTDKMIEASEGMTVSEIFDKYGESYFRRKETKLLADISRNTVPKIYSLGGGTPVALQNQGLICKCGTVIYLRARPETIYSRLKNDKTRPLLMCDDPQARIKSLMDKREAIYSRCADFIVDVDDLEQKDVVELIMNYIEENRSND